MIQLELKDMSCGHCVGVVTSTVQRLDPQAQVVVDLARKTVRIESTRERAAIATALTEAGYPPAN